MSRNTLLVKHRMSKEEGETALFSHVSRKAKLLMYELLMICDEVFADIGQEYSRFVLRYCNSTDWVEAGLMENEIVEAVWRYQNVANEQDPFDDIAAMVLADFQ